jgi:2',3'-cyclic-nucleotide 2'-phosphodiesterase (5'-nucleotidase family)
LPDALTSLRKDADFILLLSNYDLAENQDIARTCPAIDLILQTGHAVGNMNPLEINQTLIAQAEIRGKYLGVLDIDWNGHDRWSEGNAPLPQLKKGQQPSTYANRFIALKVSTPNDPEVEALVQKTQQRIEKLPKEQPR